MGQTAERPLSVLFWMPRGGDVPGGHRIQLDSTAAALRRLGVSVDVTLDDQPDFRSCAIVHGFGLSPDEIHHARAHSRWVALSTIYWDRSYRADRSGGGWSFRSLKRRAGLAFRATSAAAKGPSAFFDLCSDALHEDRWLLAAYEAADLLLPNSRGEASSIRRDLGVSTPCHIVPNAVDPARIAPSGESFDGSSVERTTVLYVGRIDPHKNQLGLIKALHGTGLHLVIVGYDHPQQVEYADICRKAGDGWVEFAPGTADVGPHYRRARVHVTPSWFETTGLVSLEAALGGCNVVSTSRGHAREYLEDHAWYCDPGDRSSIRTAVLAAFAAPVTDALRQHVLDNFTWDHAARTTLSGYQLLVDRQRAS